MYMQKTKERDSNLELYRIIVMLLIIAHHYVVNSGLTTVGGPIYENVWSFRSIFLLIFGAWGKTGINCFVLITGYFMCRSDITARKFFKLFLQIMFYRIVIHSIFWITGYEPFTLKNVIIPLIPVISIGSGFTPAFLMFFLLIPFINILIKNMNEKQHILLLSLLLFIYVFLETVPKFSVKMNYVSWFGVLYLISSYIRLYPKDIFKKTKMWGWLTVLFILTASVSVVVCAYLSDRLNTFIPHEFVQDSNTFLAVAIGVSSFLFFKNLNIKSKFINTVSATCFGVFLIHANSSYMRRWLWMDTLQNVNMYDSPYLVFHAVLSVLAVFVICSVADYLRIKFIEKPFFKMWDKHYDNVCAKLFKYKNKEGAN